MKRFKSAALILTFLLVGNAFAFAETISGTITKIDTDIDQITVEEASGKTSILSITADTKPLGLDVFKDLAQGSTVKAEVEKNDKSEIAKTNYIVIE